MALTTPPHLIFALEKVCLLFMKAIGIAVPFHAYPLGSSPGLIAGILIEQVSI